MDEYAGECFAIRVARKLNARSVSARWTGCSAIMARRRISAPATGATLSPQIAWYVSA
jgi:hypothetical protein